MSLEINVQELQKESIFIATPMYGGQCTGAYSRSMQDLTTLCTKLQIPMGYYFIANESLISRARNYLADEFMRSKMKHLLFIDADVGFSAQDVLILMHMSMQRNMPYDICAGVYPKKVISWEKIKKAVEKGAADKDPSNLEKYVGDFVFNPVKGTTQFRLDQPLEVSETGTGFMMIRRETMEKYSTAYPELSYKPDHVRTKHFDGHREITAYFLDPIDPETKRHLSEDYFFCKNARKAGMHVWIHPMIKLCHVGSYIFGGSLLDLAQIGTTPTADRSELKKVDVGTPIQPPQPERRRVVL